MKTKQYNILWNERRKTSTWKINVLAYNILLFKLWHIQVIVFTVGRWEIFEASRRNKKTPNNIKYVMSQFDVYACFFIFSINSSTFYFLNIFVIRSCYCLGKWVEILSSSKRNIMERTVINQLDKYFILFFMRTIIMLMYIVANAILTSLRKKYLHFILITIILTLKILRTI